MGPDEVSNGVLLGFRLPGRTSTSSSSLCRRRRPFIVPIAAHRQLSTRGALIAFIIRLPAILLLLHYLLHPHGSGVFADDRRASRGRGNRARGRRLSLWIDETQAKEFSGFPMKISAIIDGKVLPYVLDPNLEKYLPIIPSEVRSVNFTWTSGRRRRKSYYYHFDRLLSFNRAVLGNPTVSIPDRGRVPRRVSTFQVFLPCAGNVSGSASISIGLALFRDDGSALKGTPLRLRLKKQCAHRLPAVYCKHGCANGGWCNREKMCQCPKGYIGDHCEAALCYPPCMHGGLCSAPGTCNCPPGYIGPRCEGGICERPCEHRGRCVQKDTCACRKGYFGPRCEHSKCAQPCLNGGRCVATDRCRCKRHYVGERCGELRPGAAAAAAHRRRLHRAQRKKRKKFV